jgi:hypothetical protein
VTRYLPTEAEEQAVLVDWLRAKRIPFIVSISGAMLGGRNKWGAIAKLKKTGWRPGAPDIILLRRYLGWPVAIELKRQRGGRLSPEQIALHKEMRAERWIVIVAEGAQAAIQELRDFGLDNCATDSVRSDRDLGRKKIVK